MLDKCKFDYDRFSIAEKEEIIYDTIREWLQKESSERIIEKFRYLFIKGSGCENPQARAALESLVNTKNAERHFYIMLNRCCQLIINEWHLSPRLRIKIPLLINQISLALAPSVTQSRTTRKLRNLVINFQESEQYLKLKRLGNLIDQSKENRPACVQQKVSNLIQRYPYLHQQCLLSEDSSYEYKQTIINLQKGIQHRYELDLSRYITYRVRLVEIVRKYKANNQTKIPKKIIKPVKNPTLLSDRDLDRGLRQYLGKTENGYNLHDLASKFQDNFVHIGTHSELKQTLYNYLTSELNCKYSKDTLNPKLFNYLDSILPDIHANKVDEFTLLRTCSLLLKFLIVDSIYNANHYLFVNMVSNLGEIKTIGLLLKIVLLCDKAKPYLEQRFAILFAYYELFTRDGVTWLINSLEHLQLALSVHFGQVDLSLIKII